MDLAGLADRIVAVRGGAPRDRPTLVAISGIDASGKGFMAARLAPKLRRRGLDVALLHADDWVTFAESHREPDLSPERFYRDGFRFDELLAHAAARTGVDIVLIEGIFLLKTALRDRFDFSIWVECGFDTGLERAVARAQEGLPPAETIHAYRTLYYPAQEIHFERDRPRDAANVTIVNDPRAC